MSANIQFVGAWNRTVSQFTATHDSVNAIPLAGLTIDRGPAEWGEATRSYVKSQRRHAGRATFQGQVYNFLERPTGWKCIIYHVAV